MFLFSSIFLFGNKVIAWERNNLNWCCLFCIIIIIIITKKLWYNGWTKLNESFTPLFMQARLVPIFDFWRLEICKLFENFSLFKLKVKTNTFHMNYCLLFVFWAKSNSKTMFYCERIFSQKNKFSLDLQAKLKARFWLSLYKFRSYDKHFVFCQFVFFLLLK